MAAPSPAPASGQRLARQADLLAASLPRLIMEARRIAATLVHGLHGRRRAGSGENFWQFRHYQTGEAASRIDWRRSARDHNLYVREREWEAAHTVWVWPDRSPSMDFRSDLSQDTKAERALVLAMALADVMVKGGERVGVPGLLRPTASRAIIDKIAEAVLHAEGVQPDLPPPLPLARLSDLVILTDGLSLPEAFEADIRRLAGFGGKGHVIQVLDPIEETFPFKGRIEFTENEQGLRLIAGRAELWRDDYIALLNAHRARLREIVEARGWTFATHHTDKPAAPALLALHARMGEGR
jgi:uncharacterized protein (DUF58 family)